MCELRLRCRYEPLTDCLNYHPRTGGYRGGGGVELTRSAWPLLRMVPVLKSLVVILNLLGLIFMLLLQIQVLWNCLSWSQLLFLNFDQGDRMELSLLLLLKCKAIFYNPMMLWLVLYNP